MFKPKTLSQSDRHAGTGTNACACLVRIDHVITQEQCIGTGCDTKHKRGT